MKSLWIVIAVALLAACGAFRQSPESLYHSAEQLRRRGDLRAALDKARRGLRQQKDTRSDWHWKFRLLAAEVLLYRGESKDALSLLEPAEPPRNTDLRARWLMDSGSARFRTAVRPADRQSARQALEQAAALASGSADIGLRARIEVVRAYLQGSFEDTEACYRRALELASRQGDVLLTGTVYAGLGYNRVRHSRYDEAIPWLEKARKAADETGDTRLLGNTLGNLGLCYSALGDFERAIPLLDRAVSATGSIDDRRNQQICLGNLGAIYLRQGDVRNAMACLRRARELAERAGDHDWFSTVLRRQAEVALQTGDLAAAKSFNEESLRIRKALQSSDLMGYSELTAARIDLAEKQPQTAENRLRNLLASSQGTVLWEAHAELASLYRDQSRWEDADREFRAAISTIDGEWSRLSRDQYKFTFLAQLIRFYGEYVDFLMARGRTVEALQVADSSRARVLAQKLGRGPGGHVLRIADLQASLRRTHSMALAYWLAPHRSFLWAIAGGGVNCFTLPDENEIAALVREYQQAVRDRRDAVERDSPAARRLYQVLLEPVGEFPRDVILIPDGSLHALNFETLPVDKPRPHYWIEDVRLAVAPSLQVLQLASTAQRSGDLLFIGDPKPPGNEYPALPHLAYEAEVVQRSLKCKLYTGLDANPLTYREAGPQKYGYIHLAAHAVPNEESPLNSAVILSPKDNTYKLYANDVLGLPLQAELVTISACRGAGSKAYSGEGLMGFAWAFLEAGARHVVAGLWDVDDAATSRIMADFYQQLARGRNPPEALRYAKLQLLRSGGIERKPFFWAPLEVFTRVAE